MFNDLVSLLSPPERRAGGCDGDKEAHLTEGAVMVAFAMRLLRTMPGVRQVEIHPDGEHGKRFDFRGWLERRGFAMMEPAGGTTYGGACRDAEGRVIIVNPTSGKGDVAATVDGRSIVAECKGGVINTLHPGQLSRLRRGLCEAVGLSLASETTPGGRQFAVVPKTPTTERLARLMIQRAKAAGVDIALVDGTGNVFDVGPTGLAPSG